MAIIGNIRKRSGLLLVIVGIALAAFVLGDFLAAGPRRPQFNIGVVEGVEIPIMSFNHRLEENLMFRRQSLGRENLTQQEQFDVRQTTWDDMVREILMEKQYDKLGLSVSTEELDELIRGDNPHSFIRQSFTDPQTGEFNPASVDEFLRNLDRVDAAMRQRYLLIEQAVKDDRLQTKYRNLISKGFYVPSQMAVFDHRTKNDVAKVTTVALRYTIIADDAIEITETDLKAFYEAHSYRYHQEESRSIEFVTFEVLPSDDDRRKAEEEINKLHKEFAQATDAGLFVNLNSDSRYDSTWFGEGMLPLKIEDLLFNAPVGTIAGPFLEENTYKLARLVEVQHRPDSMRASHILISYRQTGVNPELTRTREEARLRADSIYNEIRRDRNKFRQFAANSNDDAMAATNFGDLNWFADGAMVYAFNEAVRTGRIGDIVRVETQFGFHIVEITGKTEPVRRVRVATLERMLLPGTYTVSQTYLSASRFAAENRTQEEFDNAVTNLALSKRIAEDITPLDNEILGINAPREIIRWMYDPETELGSVSPVFDVDGSYVVAVLTNIREEGIMPFEQAREIIEPLVRREKKADKLEARMREQLNKTNDLSLIAKELQTTVDTLNHITFSSLNIPLFGRDPRVVGAIFALEKGQISEPVRGDIAVYILKLQELNVREPDEVSLEGIRRVLTNHFRTRTVREAYNALLDNSDLEDSRLLFY